MFDVPVPFNLSKNDRDRRGLPIPFIVYRDTDGVPHFTVDNLDAINKVLARKLCGLCGKPLKVGQMWLIGGPSSMFMEDGMFTSPPGHEDCARYAIQVCPYMAASNYSKLIEDKTLKPAAMHGNLAVHDNQIKPPRPLFFALARTSGVKLIEAEDGSGQKFILPRRPWKELEFWLNGKPITQAEAAKIAEASDLAPAKMKYWPSAQG